MPITNKCIPFDRRRGRAKALSTRIARSGQARRSPTDAARLSEIFDHLSPAQYAFLSGVLAILSEHGEKALTKSCEMVIERFRSAD